MNETEQKKASGQTSFDSLLEKKESDESGLAFEGPLKRDSSEEILIKHNIKKLSAWFHTWHTWQKRILICSIMNCSTKQQLMVLATSLEPILHMDFSSSLVPPLQALHLDGVVLFHIQRSVTERVIQPEIVHKVDSQAYLKSLPSTFLSKGAAFFSKSSSKNTTESSLSPREENSTYPSSHAMPLMEPVQTPPKDKKKKRAIILPALPLTHLEHSPSPGLDREASFHQLLDLRRQRFSSVPDFHSSADLLRKRGKRLSEGRQAQRLLVKSKLMESPFTRPWQQKAEQFKEHLAQVTKWMNEWDGTYKSHLLSELVKLCDKNLLSYFVQCLYRQLQDQLSIHSLPDSILTNIFLYLRPKDLCTSALVCQRWNRCANLPLLWKWHTYRLGKSEGLGNVAEVVESVIKHYRHSLYGVSKDENHSLVDWKRTYRDLEKLVENMKKLVIKTARTSEENDLEERLKTAIKTQSRIHLSLMEMLEILRLRSRVIPITTQQLYEMAPESSAAMRRRLRAEKKIAEEGEPKELEVFYGHTRRRSKTRSAPMLLLSFGAWTPTHNMEFAQHLMTTMREAQSNYEKLKHFTFFEDMAYSESDVNAAEKIDLALDIRPKAPHLPDPNAIRCVVLAGELLNSHTTRPGRIMDMLRVRRLENLVSVALCMQCDSRKIVTGNYDRTINVIDIRSGRPVSHLQGHKGSVQCLQYDDYKIVSGSWDTSCIVWDIVHFTILKQLNGHSGCVACLQFDEDILVTGSHDGSLRVWNTGSWHTISVITAAHPRGVNCVKLSKEVLASGGIDKCVKVWSVSSWCCLHTLHHNAPLTALAISHLLLVSCSIDGILNMWSLKSYQPVITMRMINHAYLKQLAQFRNKFYGAGSDGVIYEIDMSTGTCLRILQGHSLAITAICIAGYRLMTTGADKTIVAWLFERPPKIKDQDSIDDIIIKVPNPFEDEDNEGGGEMDFSETNTRDYHYKRPKFYSKLLLKVVVGKHVDCCGFVYDH